MWVWAWVRARARDTFSFTRSVFVVQLSRAPCCGRITKLESKFGNRLNCVGNTRTWLGCVAMGCAVHEAPLKTAILCEHEHLTSARGHKDTYVKGLTSCMRKLLLILHDGLVYLPNSHFACCRSSTREGRKTQLVFSRCFAGCMVAQVQKVGRCLLGIG